MRNIDKYEGLYGERGVQPGAEYLFSEELETRSRSFNWEIQPHIHPRLYQLFFVQQGDFIFYAANEQRSLSGPCLILVPPASLHGFTYTSGAKGHILTLSDQLIDSLLPGSEVLIPMLRHIQYLTNFAEPCSSERMGLLIKNINEELFSHHPEKRLMLKACLQQLLLSVFRMWKHNGESKTGSDPIALQHFRKFQQRIRQTGTTHTIEQLATELGMTAVHLNRICKQITGKPAGRLLQEYILEEARKYLTYTSYSVAEIAYLLNFEYPNYFARFFRKHTGMTPSAFRENEK